MRSSLYVDLDPAARPLVDQAGALPAEVRRWAADVEFVELVDRNSA